MMKNKFPDKSFIIRQMKSGVVNFKFEKTNGELREMNATLVSSQIPPTHHKETNPNPHNSSEDLIVCWDVENVGWRSFKLSTLKEYNGQVMKV